MHFHPRTIIPFALALASVVPVVSPARAADDVYRLRVHYRGGELANWDGAASVYDRIARAARRSCGEIGALSLTDQALARMCRRELVGRAVARVGNPILAAVHEGRRPAGSTAASGLD